MPVSVRLSPPQHVIATTAGILGVNDTLVRLLWRNPPKAPLVLDAMDQQYAQSTRRLREICGNPDVGDWLSGTLGCTKLKS